jgi:hypothetical protein
VQLQSAHSAVTSKPSKDFFNFSTKVVTFRQIREFLLSGEIDNIMAAAPNSTTKIDFYDDMDRQRLIRGLVHRVLVHVRLAGDKASPFDRKLSLVARFVASALTRRRNGIPATVRDFERCRSHAAMTVRLIKQFLYEQPSTGTPHDRIITRFLATSYDFLLDTIEELAQRFIKLDIRAGLVERLQVEFNLSREEAATDAAVIRAALGLDEDDAESAA